MVHNPLLSHVLALLLSLCGGFNIDTLSPYVITGEQPGSYFGYKVALHQYDNTGYVLVSVGFQNFLIPLIPL